MTDAYIESFVQAFEDGSLSKSEWTHSRHLVMALWYLRRHDRDEATRLIRDGIQRHNESQENFTGYHETITMAWIAVIERFLGVRDLTCLCRCLPASCCGNAATRTTCCGSIRRSGSSPTRRELAGCLLTWLRSGSLL